MAREADSYGVTCGVLTIAPGATNALLVSPVPGQANWVLKFTVGGSLEILGAPPPYNINTQAGQTLWSAAQLVALAGTGYPLDTNPINADGATRFYLMAQGATCQAVILRGLTSGF